VFSFSELRDLLSAAWKRQEGQTMAEYAVVLAVITLAVVGIFIALSGGITTSVSKVKNILP
jgi:Flp pilus assembly pilin Flp